MWKYERKTVDEKAEENHSGSCGDQHSIVPRGRLYYIFAWPGAERYHDNADDFRGGRIQGKCTA